MSEVLSKETIQEGLAVCAQTPHLSNSRDLQIILNSHEQLRSDLAKANRAIEIAIEGLEFCAQDTRSVSTPSKAKQALAQIQAALEGS